MGAVVSIRARTDYQPRRWMELFNGRWTRFFLASGPKADAVLNPANIRRVWSSNTVAWLATRSGNMLARLPERRSKSVDLFFAEDGGEWNAVDAENQSSFREPVRFRDLQLQSSDLVAERNILIRHDGTSCIRDGAEHVESRLGSGERGKEEAMFFRPIIGIDRDITLKAGNFKGLVFAQLSDGQGFSFLSVESAGVKDSLLGVSSSPGKTDDLAAPARSLSAAGSKAIGAIDCSSNRQPVFGDGDGWCRMNIIPWPKGEAA